MFDHFLYGIVMGIITIGRTVFGEAAHSVLPFHKPALGIVCLRRVRLAQSLLQHGSHFLATLRRSLIHNALEQGYFTLMRFHAQQSSCAVAPEDDGGQRTMVCIVKENFGWEI